MAHQYRCLFWLSNSYVVLYPEHHPALKSHPNRWHLRQYPKAQGRANLEEIERRAFQAELGGCAFRVEGHSMRHGLPHRTAEWMSISSSTPGSCWCVRGVGHKVFRLIREMWSYKRPQDIKLGSPSSKYELSHSKARDRWKLQASNRKCNLPNP